MNIDPKSPLLSAKALAASQMAHAIHAAQTRKYTGRPYFEHLDRVAFVVSQLPGATEDMVCAAYLHDTLEDQAPTPELRQAIGAAISRQFGTRVFDYVYALTNPSKGHPDKSRSERKQMDRDHLKDQCVEVRRIKLVDRLDNIAETLFDSMVGYATDFPFQRLYLRESIELLHVLKGTDPLLERRMVLVLGQMGEWLNMVEFGMLNL